MKRFLITFLILIIVGAVIVSCTNSVFNYVIGEYDKDFVILSNPDNILYSDEVIKFGKENDINITFVQADDLEAIDLLEMDSSKYDAVWLSNSTWLYMLNGVSTSNSKSVSINPVVFGVKKSKAEKLGFIGKDIYNKDIVDAIKAGKLSYVMSSVTKTNTGMIAY